MARVPRSALERLNAETDAIVERAAQVVAVAISNGATDAELTELVKQLCRGVADMSAARAAVFYRANRILQTGEALSASPYPGYDANAVERTVRETIGNAKDHPETLAADIALQLDYSSRRAIGETMLNNVLKDPMNPRFARVPVGAETCGFCIMLASRGFVYPSRRSAGEHRHYHPNCDCLIVPMYGDGSIEGYDHKEYLQKYEDNVVHTQNGGVDTKRTLNAMNRAEYDKYKDRRNRLRRERYAQTHKTETSA